MNLRYTDRAKSDIDIAFEWYEKQRRGPGLAFLSSVEASIKKIIRSPKMYPIIHSNFHRCIMRRFPFSIFYTIEAQALIIHAVFDNRQAVLKLP